MIRNHSSSTHIATQAFLLSMLTCIGAQEYQHRIVAESGISGIVNVLPGASINNRGDVAFLAEVATGSTTTGHVFVVRNGLGPAIDISPNLSPANTSTLGPGVQINDNGTALTRRLWLQPTPLGNNPVSTIEAWDGNTTGNFSQLVLAQPLLAQFDGVFGHPSISNCGAAVFAALDGNDNRLGTLQGSTPCDTGQFTVVLSGEVPRPMLDDERLAVVRVGDASGWIGLFPPAFFPNTRIADANNGGFTSVGARPGTSDRTQVVAFAGDRGQGPSVFVSVPNGASRELVKVAGEGDGFTNVALDQRIGVQGTLLVENGSLRSRLSTVVFEAERNSVHGLWTVDVFTRGNGTVFTSRVSRALSVLAVGDAVGNAAAQGFDLHDPINDCGQIACAVETSGGRKIIIAERTGVRPPVRLRIAAKQVLDQASGMPGSGAFDWTIPNITTVIGAASTILEQQAGVQLILSCLTSLPDPTGTISLFDFDDPILLEIVAAGTPNTVDWRDDAINVYFSNTVTSDDGDFVGGIGSPPYGLSHREAVAIAPPQAGVVDPMQRAAERLAHEIGHYCNLYHPHETALGTEQPPTAWVTGAIRATNAGRAGDLVCDTLPDPFTCGTGTAGVVCESQALAVATSWYGSGTSEYEAVIHNLMSYYFSTRRDELTPGQVDRLHQGIDLFRGHVVDTSATPPALTDLGPGCSALAGTPQLGVTPPVIGEAVCAWVSGFPGLTQGWVVLSLPPAAPTILLPGCSIYVDTNFLQFPPFVTDLNGRADQQLLPFLPQLPLGLPLVMQAYSVTLPSLSNGVQVTVGG